MKPYDVLVIGRSCLDYIAVVSQFPGENRKTPLESRMIEGGGQGGTASCAVTKLGGRVAYVGKLGNDPEGRLCRERLEFFGVPTQFLEDIPGGVTPVAYIIITQKTGARTICYERSALPKIIIDERVNQLIDHSNVILLDPETTYLGNILAQRKNRQSLIVYDCESWRNGIEGIMKIADYFIPSADFLQSPELAFEDLPLPQQFKRLERMIKGRLIVTDGEKGAYYSVNGRINQVKAPTVAVLDTLGAGDVFHGAFALAVSRGLELPQAVKLSVAAASLSCRDYGGRRGIPNWDEAMETSRILEVIRL
jgi:sugar/nucleoside kinase (ribokinase family)